MRRAGIRGLAALPRRTRTTDSRHGYPIAPNRLGRDFTAAVPNQVWLADLTYIPTGEGWLYLAAALNTRPRKALGWKTPAEALDQLARRRQQRPCCDDRLYPPRLPPRRTAQPWLARTSRLR